MNAADRGMGFGLRALNRLAGLELIDRIGMRERAERALFRATKNGFRAAGAAGRTFAAVQKRGKPARQPTGERTGLFDITPTDEQQMMREAVGDFALERLRPAAQDADSACQAPAELLAQSAELGVAMLGVPEELGGVVSERSAVTSVLVSEAMARGDMGLAFAALAPGAVSTAIGLWGDGDQQSTYLPEFSGSEPPAAALAMLEPRPLFDPFALETRARASNGGYVLSGVKSLVPRVAEDELFVVAAELEGKGPALFIVESKLDGVLTEPEPAMGLRAGATGRLLLRDVKLDAGALLGAASPEVYADCVRLGRIAWCALATGTAQAVLDYVKQYVNERSAFGEPISHRQASCLQRGEHRDRARGDAARHLPRRRPRRPGARLRPRGRHSPTARRPTRDADRLRRRPAAGRPRLRQGAPRRALVPRPARGRADGGGVTDESL